MLDGKLEEVKRVERLQQPLDLRIPFGIVMSRAGLEPATHWFEHYVNLNEQAREK